MSHEASVKDRSHNVLQKALYMASGTLTSRILGLLRDMALGALFDRGITDAWTAAFRIPNLFRRLLGEGALSLSFIPVFIEAQSSDPSGGRARNLLNGIYSVLLLVVGGLSLLGIIFVEPVFRMLLSETFAMSVQKWEMTLRMGQIMFGFTFFVTLYAFYMGILNALGSFAWPAVAPALLNISMLVFTFMPAEYFARPGDGLAWGVLVGGVAQAGLLYVVLRRKEVLPQFALKSIWSPKVGLVFKRFLPGLMGLGLLQLSTLVNLYFASTLPVGALSYIYWADRLLELPLSLISVSIGSALLPTLSEFANLKQWEKFQDVAEESLLTSLFWALPAALGLYFLAGSIVDVLFHRGQFSENDLNQTVRVLEIYALSLVAISCARVLTPLYFSQKNTRFPMLMSVVGIGTHILLASFFSRYFGLVGLIYAFCLAAFVNVIGLFWGAFRGQGQRISATRMWSRLVRILVSGGVLALILKTLQALRSYFPGPLWMYLLFSILISCTFYFGTAMILKSQEVIKIRRSFRP